MLREIKYFIAILLFVTLAIAASAGTAQAQGSRKDDIVFNAQGRPMAGATVRVCTSAGTGQPCTPLAQVYSDPALTQALANPLSADGLGNYNFYAAPGRYMIELSGPGILTKQIPNVILPNDPSAPTFTSVTATSGISAFSLSLTGNLTVNGSIAVAGSLTVGGLPVPTANQDNQWTAGQRFKGPIPWRDISGYMPAGGCSSNTTPTDPTTTGTISSGSQSLALASARDFKTGCGIAVLNAGPTSVIATPNQGCSISSIARASNVVTVTCAAAHGIPVYGSDHAQGIQITGVTDSSYNGTFDVTSVADTTHFSYSETAANSSSSGGTATMQFGYAHGVTGSTTYKYKVSAVDGLGGMSAASSAITVSSGNASLNTSNYNWINFGVASAIAANVPHEWVIYSDKGLGGGYFCVGTAFTNAYSDFGMPLPCPAFAPATPPASATPQVLNAIISAGGGTTALTLSVAAANNATTQKTYHDESSFLNSCITDDISDKNGSFASGAYGCYIPAGNYFLNGQLGTDSNTSVNGTTIYVAGTVYLNIFPWYFSQSEVYVMGLGDSGGNGQFSTARTSIVYVAPELASAVVIRGGSHVEFSGFDIFNLQGHGIWVGQVPYLNAPNSYRFDNDIIALAAGAAGAPLVFDANVIGVWSNHTSLTPNSSAIGLPAIYETATGWDSQPNCCMYFDNLTTASRGVKVDAPGGNGSGGGHNSLFFNSWISESLTSSELGLAVHDNGPNAPGTFSSGMPLIGISLHNLNNSDPVNGPAAYALITEMGSTATISADVYNVGAFGLLLNCGPNTTACNDRPSMVANVSNGPTGGTLGGSIQLASTALDVEAPILSQIGYPSLGTFQPAWAQVLPPPNTFTITGTGAGSLAANTYCMAVEGKDARATPGLTLPSNILCQTVGASSSISVSWKQGNSSLTGYYSGFRFLFCATGGSSCVPGTYLDLSASVSSPYTYTFPSTAGGTAQALNVVPTAYYSWLYWENIPSCLFCNGITNLESQLGIGDASPPAAAKLSVKGGTINAGGGITSGNINSIFFVDGVKYSTLSSALAACPANGCLVIDTLPETWAADPFGSVTSPFTVWLMPGAATALWKTNVALRIGHSGQIVHGCGPNCAIVQAVSGTFPSNSAVFSVGAPGPSGVSGSRIDDLAVDCQSITGCTGISLDGVQELSGTSNTQVVNAMTAGYRVSSDQGAGATQNQLPLEHIRAICSVSAPSSCTPVEIAASAGDRVVVRDITAVIVPPSTVTDCIKNDGTTDDVLIEDAHVEECTNGFHNTAVGGQFEVNGIIGLSNVTTLVRNDSSAASYSLRRVNRNGATNALVDAGRSITTTAPSCSVAGVATPYITCLDAAVPWQIASPLEATGTGAGLSGTGACATITTQLGGSWGGSFKCTGTTGASTVTITLAATAKNGWNCSKPTDITTTTNLLNQTASTATTCVFGATTVNANDVIYWSGFPF